MVQNRGYVYRDTTLTQTAKTILDMHTAICEVATVYMLARMSSANQS